MNALTPILKRGGLLGRPSWDLFDRFFEDFGLPAILDEKGLNPAFDLSETEKELIVRVEAPGVDRKNIEINLSEGLLTVKGEKKQEKEDRNENYHSVERRYGTFSRTLLLPCEVEAEKVEANYKDGVLKITLPKCESAKPKRIEIH